MSDMDPGLNAIVFGPSKAGKSWLGDSTPGPRLILDAEAGSRWTPSTKRRWNPSAEEPPVDDGTWESAVVPVRSFKDVLKSYEWLNSGQHPFRSVVMDSISEVQQRAVDDLVGTDAMKMQDWGQLLRQVSDVVRKFRDLVSHPTNPLDAVLFIAMARQVDGVWRPHVQGQLAVTLPYYVDLTAYIAPVKQEDGTQLRRLFCGTFPGFETGERLGGRIPQYIDNPDMTDIINMIRNPAGSVAAAATDTKES